MKLDLLRSIKILALYHSENPSWDSWYRSICRWYSREFSTDLDKVENDLHPEHVLTHYYEDLYGDLYEKTDQNEEIAKVYADWRTKLLYEEEQVDRDVEDDDWERKMLEEIREEEARLAKLEAVKEKGKPEPLEIPEDSPKPDENPNLKEEILSLSEVLNSSSDFEDSLPDDESE